MDSNKNNLLEKIKNLPSQPGCYLWKNNLGEIIYIGKAKNLLERTSQYFNNKHLDQKTQILVSKICDIDYIIVDNENDSLLLEMNLIKKHKPKYNILLRENNNYPYIVVTDEAHPRILYTRNPEKFKGKKYGPFANSNFNKYQLFIILNRMFPLRKCNKLPSSKCIFYDINQCLGPCIKKVDPEQYQIILQQINNLFKGDINKVKEELIAKELAYSEKLDFENANYYLEISKSLDYIINNNQIIFDKKKDFDFFSFFVHENTITIVIFKYNKGMLLDKYELTNFLFASTELEYIKSFLITYYTDELVVKPKSIYISIRKEELCDVENIIKIDFINPKSGKMLDTMNTAMENAKLANKSQFYKLLKNFNRNENALLELEKILKIDNLSLIEAYDNSNIFNTEKVGVKIAYINGYKNPKLYRKFIIKNQNAQSDFEYMEEVIYRRFLAIKNGKDNIIPNLIILDGSKPQITAAKNAFKKLNLEGLVPIIALAKDEKHKTKSIILENYEEIVIDKKSDLYLFLFNIQEEVHRYAISFFRNKKSNSLLTNKLEDVEGLGKKRIKKLLEKYDTFDEIINASLDELSQIIPRDVAKKIKKI
ncbi:MAG: excinuclease ABC subunit UvrC [Mycoplasmoidaceae bacterium]